MNRRAFLGTAAASLAAARRLAEPHRRRRRAQGRLKQGVTRGVFGRGVPLEDCRPGGERAFKDSISSRRPTGRS